MDEPKQSSKSWSSWVEIIKGVFARRVVIAEEPTTKTSYTMNVASISHLSGTAVELDLAGKQLTRYRYKPSADMRVAEDASNVMQAEAWLQVGVSPLADGEVFCRPPVAANTWSDWQYFSAGNYLSNLWFALDAAGAGATALVEAE